MKGSAIKRLSESSDIDANEQVIDAVTDVIKNSNDKVVEIRPANESKGGGKFPLMLLVGTALAVGYWLRKSQDPAEELQGVASETADRTRDMTTQAAETIQESGETVAERVEEGSQKVGERFEQTGESAAERVEEESQKAGEEIEQTGESTAEKTEQAGEKAAEKADESGDDSSNS